MPPHPASTEAGSTDVNTGAEGPADEEEPTLDGPKEEDNPLPAADDAAALDDETGGNALLLPEETVKKAAQAYRDADVVPFAGGILFEYAWQKNQVPEMIEHLHKLGLKGVELSENYIELTTEQRLREIDRLQKGGLKVVYEFGRKNPVDPMSFEYVAGLVAEVGQLGIDHITVEQCEIDLLAQASPSALADLQRQPWFDNLLIEVDPYRFPQQHAQIIRDFGPEVNLANVTPGQVLRLEGFRLGIGRAVDYSLIAR